MVVLLDGHEAVPDLEEGANEVNELVHGKQMAAKDRQATKLSQLKSCSTDTTGWPFLTARVPMKVILLAKTKQRLSHRVTATGALRLDQPRFQTEFIDAR
jgi:hypothetical protein